MQPKMNTLDVKQSLTCLYTNSKSVKLSFVLFLLLLKHTLYYNLQYNEIHITFKYTSKIFFLNLVSLIQKIIYLKSSIHILMPAVPAVSPCTSIYRAVLVENT